MLWANGEGKGKVRGGEGREKRKREGRREEERIRSKNPRRGGDKGRKGSGGERRSKREKQTWSRAGRGGSVLVSRARGGGDGESPWSVRRVGNTSVSFSWEVLWRKGEDGEGGEEGERGSQEKEKEPPKSNVASGTGSLQKGG